MKKKSIKHRKKPKKNNKKRRTKKTVGGMRFANPQNNELIASLDTVPLTETLLADETRRPDRILERLNMGIPFNEAAFDFRLVEALELYQEFSYYVNGLLREGVTDYYSNMTIKNILKLCDMNDSELREQQAKQQVFGCIRENLQKISTLIKTFDNAFDSPLCQRFENRTVLFRGTDSHYDESISKAFISTTKSLKNLFDMAEGPIQFFNMRTKCCINVLIIDAGIPYLDLEIPGQYWSYQQEILLPRNLICILVGEDTYTHKGIDYKAYIYEIKLNNQPIYKSVPLNLHIDLASQEEITSFLVGKRELIQKFLKNIQYTEEVLDKMQEIHFWFENLMDMGMRYFCSRDFIEMKDREIMNVVNKLNAHVLANNLIKPGMEAQYNDAYALLL